MKIISFMELRINSNTNNKEIAESLPEHQFVIFKKGRITKKFKLKHSYATFQELDLKHDKLTPSLNIDLIIQSTYYKSNFLRLYQRFNQNLFNKSYIELETIYRKYLKYSESIVDNKDSILIFSDIPHSPVEYIFYVYAKVNNINMIFINMLPRLNQHANWPIYYSNDFTPDVQIYANKIEIYSKYSDEFNIERTEDEFLYYFDMFNNQSKKKEIMILEEILLKQYYDLILTTLLNIFSLRSFLVILIKALKGFIFSPLEKLLLSSTLKNLEQHEIPEGFEILYYPLHMQPEATVIPAGNELYDQLLIIDSISRAMSNKQLLIVKEHPATLSVKSIAQPELRHPFRSVNFYKNISKYPNVIFINRDISSELIIRKSRFIITIRGSVTLESLILNKPVLLFGDSLYNSFPNTIRINSFNQLKTILSGENVNKTFNSYPVMRLLSDISLIGSGRLKRPTQTEIIVKKINELQEKRKT